MNNFIIKNMIIYLVQYNLIIKILYSFSIIVFSFFIINCNKYTIVYAYINIAYLWLSRKKKLYLT